MEEILKTLIQQAMRPLLDEIRLLRTQVAELQSKSLTGKLISASQAGQLVGKSSNTIGRWCRGFELEGQHYQLKASRQPSGRYLIDERDLLAFNQQITDRFSSAQPPVPVAVVTNQKYKPSRQSIAL